METDPLSFFRNLSYKVKSNFNTLTKTTERAILNDKFKQAWEGIVNDYRISLSPTLGRKHVSETFIVKNLQTLGDVLLREQAVTPTGVEPGGCTELFLNDDMLAQLVKMSETDSPTGFQGEVIRFLGNMITVLDPRILIQNAVHRPTLTLIHAALADKIPVAYEEDMLILECDIAGLVKERPELLYIFFSKSGHFPRNVSKESIEAGQAFTNSSPSPSSSPLQLRTTTTTTAAAAAAAASRSLGEDAYTFPLFDHLLRYVHLEGPKGDFAREASLNLLELTTNIELESYIANSDFTSVAIAGLGGLFSQLPLRVPDGVEWGEKFKSSLDPLAKQQQQQKHQVGRVVKVSLQDAFRRDIKSFTRFLSFIQAVVLSCPSEKITAATLHAFRETFLDNILSSSIHSSSDFDGTTIATLFYVRQMVECIREDQMSALLSLFLLKPDPEPATTTTPHQQPNNNTTEDLSLQIRDLLISKLNSLSEQVVTATLYLLQSLLAHHSTYALPLLIEQGLPIPKPYFNGKMVVTSPQSSSLVFSPLSPNAPGLLKEQNERLRKVGGGGGGGVVDIQEHLLMVARYFALVPADHSTTAETGGGLSSSVLNIGLPQAPPPLPPREPISGGGNHAGVAASSPPRTPPSSLRYRSLQSNPSGTPLRHHHPQALSSGGMMDSNSLSVYLLQADSTLKTQSTPPPRARAFPPAPPFTSLLSLSPHHHKPSTPTDFPDDSLSPAGHPNPSTLSSTHIQNTPQISKDPTLLKLLSKFSNFFSHSFEINLALTGLLSTLASLPHPTLYQFLYNGDLNTGTGTGAGGGVSFYTILIRLRREVEERRKGLEGFEGRLEGVRRGLMKVRREDVGKKTVEGLGEDEEVLMKNSPSALEPGNADLDLDEVFLRNVVVLEEFVKELLAVLVMHGSREYDEISYMC
ncbi:hypothetical protein HDV05_002118 [Chytridiales sp. JEL 0842]|nr:hypothetical protein HDV05_002118 [Chytridiales sp. JEL 0842]